MSKTRFAEYFLLVPDLTTAEQFYEGALGLEPAERSDESVTYDVVGTELKLQADYPSEVFEEFNLERPPHETRGQGSFVAIETTDDLDQVYQRIADSDGTALIEPRDVPWLNGRMFLAQDPFGYTIEIRHIQSDDPTIQ